MSRLDELIKEKCPNGVKYTELGRVCDITKGRGLSKSDKGTGDVPIILYGELYTTYGNYIDEVVSSASETAKNSLLIAKNDLLLPVSSTTKEAQIGKASVYRLDNECYLGGDAIRLRHEQNPGFLMYIINSTAFEKQKMKCVSGTTINHLNPGKLSKIKVPIPPLEVQNEIVHILDNFAELTAELTAELSNRKKQYEYYRDLLLNFNENGQRVKWSTLDKIAEIGTGSHNTIEEVDNGKYPFYVRSQEVRSMNSYDYDENAIITAGDGVGVGKVFHYVDGKYSLHQRAYRIHITQNNVLPKYFYYYFVNSFYPYIKRNSFHASVTSIRRPMLNRFPVPIPSIEEQQRIINVLDRFDKLTSNISEGLPAEIEARKKQYAYYRDKLLTFEEAK